MNNQISRLMSHIRDPLYRNGYALVISSAITSGLGVLYWILAARNYTTEAVGLNTAIISMMIFLAHVSQFNMRNALNRFVPGAGQATKRLVGYSYLISLAMTLVTSLIFILGIDFWAPKLSFFGSSPFFIFWFTLATMAWGIFVLEESVLIGLRQAVWVPVVNLIFATSKIGLLYAFAIGLADYGPFASWTVPALLLLLPVNYLIFRRLIPQQAKTKQVTPIVPAQIAKYVAGDYLGSLATIATTTLLPLIVLERAGATATAYYYLSWTIAYALYLVSRNMGMSLITEAAIDLEKLNGYSYRIFVQSARLVVPVVAIIVLLAPYLLQLFGKDYAAEATILLRLLSLSAIPNIITSLYIDIARVQRRMSAIIVVQGLLSSLVLILSYILLEVYGVMGVGIAWLISQSIIAVGLLLTELRSVWTSNLNWQSALRLVALPRRLCSSRRHRQRIEKAEQLVPHILPKISPQLTTSAPTSWEIQHLLPTESDMTVIMLGPKGEAAEGVLKLPQSNQAIMSLLQQLRVLDTLHADARLSDWRTLLPTVLAKGKSAGQAYIVEEMLTGLEGRKVLSNPMTRRQMQRAAVIAIGRLHQRTAKSVLVDDNMLKRWVDEPILILRGVKGMPFYRGKDKALDRLANELHQRLGGRKVTVSWVHGDFAPRNILVSPDGTKVTGIVDWEDGTENDLPQIDLILLLLSTRMFVQKRELGDVIIELLNGGKWTAYEGSLLEAAEFMLPGDPLEMRTILLLCWLRHISSNLSKSKRYMGNWLWVRNNIEAVLRAL